jgi:hypothetical protein
MRAAAVGIRVAAADEGRSGRWGLQQPMRVAAADEGRSGRYEGHSCR